MQLSKSLYPLISLLLLSFLFIQCFSSAPKVSSNSQPITHEIFDGLLKKHVTKEGLANYKGLQADRETLDRYLNLVAANHPNDANWSKNAQKAYWMNVYNAYTIALILDNYPVASIKDISSGPNIPFVNTPWDIQFIEIEKQKYDLNNVEHNILRKYFDDPRIHFGINCASISCPNLAPFAFTEAKVNEQLDQLATTFINDPQKNKITTDKAEISKIFSWFKGDFVKKESLISFLNRYAATKINEDATIEHLDYDWGLNDAP